MQYALEGRTNDAPNGHFYLTKGGTEAVTKEVVNTHLGKAVDQKKYVADKMAALWPRYDVNDDGYIDAIRGTTFLRQVLGEVELQGGLQ